MIDELSNDQKIEIVKARIIFWQKMFNISDYAYSSASFEGDSFKAYVNDKDKITRQEILSFLNNTLSTLSNQPNDAIM